MYFYANIILLNKYKILLSAFLRYIHAVSAFSIRQSYLEMQHCIKVIKAVFLESFLKNGICFRKKREQKTNTNLYIWRISFCNISNNNQNNRRSAKLKVAPMNDWLGSLQFSDFLPLPFFRPFFFLLWLQYMQYMYFISINCAG